MSLYEDKSCAVCDAEFTDVVGSDVCFDCVRRPSSKCPRCGEDMTGADAKLGICTDCSRDEQDVKTLDQDIG